MSAPAVDFQSLCQAASAYQAISPGLAEWVKIYLLQQIAGNAMTPQQLITAVNGYQMIDAATAKRIEIFLLGQIVG